MVSDACCMYPQKNIRRRKVMKQMGQNIKKLMNLDKGHLTCLGIFDSMLNILDKNL